MTLDADRNLATLAAQGDGYAFAELYRRYFPKVYDFACRLLQEPDEAARVARETFLAAVARRTELAHAATPRSWLYGTARELALARLEQLGRLGPVPLPATAEPAGSPAYWRVNPGLGTPPSVGHVSWEVASLVWQVAAVMDRRRYALLDLHLRQGLDSGEIAEILGTGAASVAVMLAQLRQSVEEEMAAHLMMHLGRRGCAALDHLVGGLRVGRWTPEARRAVAAHVASCKACQASQARLAPPLHVFAALGAVPPPPQLEAQVYAALAEAWLAAPPPEPPAPWEQLPAADEPEPGAVPDWPATEEPEPEAGPGPPPVTEAAPRPWETLELPAMVPDVPPEEDAEPAPAGGGPGSRVRALLTSPLGSLLTGMAASFLLVAAILALGGFLGVDAVLKALGRDGAAASIAVPTETPTPSSTAAALVTPERVEFTPVPPTPTPLPPTATPPPATPTPLPTATPATPTVGPSPTVATSPTP